LYLLLPYPSRIKQLKKKKRPRIRSSVNIDLNVRDRRAPYLSNRKVSALGHSTYDGTFIIIVNVFKIVFFEKFESPPFPGFYVHYIIFYQYSYRIRTPGKRPLVRFRSESTASKARSKMSARATYDNNTARPYTTIYTNSCFEPSSALRI